MFSSWFCKSKYSELSFINCGRFFCISAIFLFASNNSFAVSEGDIRSSHSLKFRDKGSNFSLITLSEISQNLSKSLIAALASSIDSALN